MAEFFGKVNDFLDKVSTFVPFAVIVVLVVMLIVLIVARPKNMTSREICMMAAAISASFVLSYIKVPIGANGGSMTAASYIPLIIFCYAYGTPKGLLAALIYSVLQIIQEPYLINPIQIALDYTIPFTLIGLAAVLRPACKEMKCYDILIAVPVIYLLRFTSHVISGVFYFDTPLVGSMAYSAGYIIPDFIITFAALIALLATGSFIRLVKIINPASRALPVLIENEPETAI